MDWNLVTTGGSIDYRNRIVGARLLAEGKEPYHYKWKKGEDPELCDPFNNMAMTVSLTTVSPSALLVMMPLAALPYGTSQTAWLVIQWLLLLGMGFLGWKFLAPGWRQWCWAAALTGFTFTLAWRHHVDRGQIYIVLAFLLAVWAALSADVFKRGNHSLLLAGVIAGILITLRPPLALLLAPYIALRSRVQIAGAVMGLVVFTLLPMAYRSTIWEDYFRGMKGWSEYHRAGEKPHPPAQAYPVEIEGIHIDRLSKINVRQIADSSIFKMLKSNGIHGFSEWPLLMALALGTGLWYWCRLGAAPLELLSGIAAWTFLSDWFLPAYRNPYNDVMILPLIALVLARGSLARWLLLLALPAGWFLYHVMPTARWQIYIPTAVLAVFTLLSLLPDRGRRQPVSK